MPPPLWGRGHYKMGTSVSPSLCHVPQPNSRMERPRKPKISSMEVHHTSKPRSYLEVKRSMSPARLTLKSELHPIFQTERRTNFKLDTRRNTKNRITDKRCDLQGQRSRSQGHVMHLTGVVDKSRTKRPRNTKVGCKYHGQ